MEKPTDRKRTTGKRPSVSAQMLKTMRQWATGVVIVSSQYRGEKSGMTVSAFISTTIVPPSILVCLNKSALTLKMIRRSKRLAVSVLSEKQKEISVLFSGVDPLIQGNIRFRGLQTFTAKTGSPILRGCVGWLDCRVSRLVKVSSHYVVFCEVVAAGQNGRADKPLLYHDRKYRRISGQ